MPSNKNVSSPTIGLSMIVKDGAADLPHCLDSVRGLVSQIVIADTGSTDASASIGSEAGSELIHYPWTGHFAEARNAALAPITTDWVLVLDADEELSSEARAAIPQLLYNAQENVGGYLLPIRNYLPDLDVQFRDSVSVPNLDHHPRAHAALSWAEHRLCRLFRRHSFLSYAGRVHEVVEHSIVAAGFALESANCRILHFGQLATADARSRKASFYRDLGRLKVKEEPQNAFAWFELGGIELTEFNNQPLALQCLQNAVTLLPTLAEAWILLFHLHDARREFDLAFAVYQRLARLGAPLSFQILQRTGDYQHDRGHWHDAAALYRQALEQARADSNISVLSRLAVESRLGYTEIHLGLPQGLEKLARAAIEAPSLKDNQLRLAQALLALTSRAPTLTPTQSPLLVAPATPAEAGESV